VETKNLGFHGTAYLNFPSNGGYVEFADMGGDGGEATLNIRYALGNTARAGELIVNGVSQSITFDSTEAWATWEIKSVTVNLNSGWDNTIRLESTGQDLANIDEIQILTGPVPTLPPTSTPTPSLTPTPTVPPTPTPTLDPNATPTPTPDTSFSGTVIDFAGDPIPGATVRLENAGNSTTTASDGSFTLGSPGGSAFDDTLVVSKAEYLDYETRMYNQPEASGLVIRMADADHPVWSREMLYEEGEADFPSCHASSIVELPDGTLLSVFFGGSKESADDVEVRLSRKEPGQDWELPIALTNAPNDGLSVENPNIFQDREGKIFVFWSSTHANPDRIGMMRTSTDGGNTWSAARELGNNIIGPEKNKCVQLEDGTIMCPTADRNGQFPGGSLLTVRSFDGGETWQGQTGADDGDVDDAIQPAIMFHADGRLQMMSRNKGFIPTTWSYDNGETWSTLQKTVMPANGSGIDAVTLRDGRQLLVYNHVPTPEGSKGDRCFLNAAISDDGVNWSAAQVLGICDGGQFSYPAVIQSRDGLVHITHTWHRDTIAHIVLNPYLFTDDTTEPMPDGEWPTSGPLSREENQDKEG
jgi:predicted neuraminidase